MIDEATRTGILLQMLQILSACQVYLLGPYLTAPDYWPPSDEIPN